MVINKEKEIGRSFFQKITQAWSKRLMTAPGYWRITIHNNGQLSCRETFYQQPEKNRTDPNAVEVAQQAAAEFFVAIKCMALSQAQIWFLYQHSSSSYFLLLFYKVVLSKGWTEIFEEVIQLF